MDTRIYATVDKLSSHQQGMEESMMRHRGEMLQTTAARIEHACNQTEESAIQRSYGLIDPRLTAVEELIRAHCQSTRGETDEIWQAIKTLSDYEEDTSKGLGAVKAEVEKLAGRVDDLLSKLAEEVSARESLGKDAFSQIEALREAASEDRKRQSAGEEDVARRFEESYKEFRSSLSAKKARDEILVQSLSERTDEQVSDLAKKIDDKVEFCSKEAALDLGTAVSQLEQHISEAVAEIDRGMAASAATAQSMLTESIETVRTEINARATDAISVAEMSADQKLQESCEKLQNEISQLEERCKKASNESDDRFHEALQATEARLASVDKGILVELGQWRDKTLTRQDALRSTLNRTMQAESKQAKRENNEITKSSAHARDKLEARLQEQVEELSNKVSGLETQFARESEGLHVELQKLPTTRHVAETSQVVADRCDELAGVLVDHSKRLESVHGGLSARCSDMQNDTSEVQYQLDQKLSGLSTEVASLRAAATSLTHGVVEALQIIGLVEACPNSATSTATGRKMTTDSEIGLQDLLAWEKTGNSLATRIVKQWNRRDMAGTPTVLAALGHRLAVEEHTVALELIRKAPLASWSSANLSKAADVQPCPLPPLSPAKGGGPPTAVANMRQQRVAPQTSAVTS